jgi:hypothetical protein
LALKLVGRFLGRQPLKSSEMAFPAFWEDVVISDPINCHKLHNKVKTDYYVAKNSNMKLVFPKNSMFMIFLRYFPNILKNRENLIKIGRPGELYEFSVKSGEMECLFSSHEKTSCQF